VQRVYYDVGVGVEEPGFVTKVGATLYRWAGLAFGAGLVRNVVEAYREIVCNYDPEGRVFLFGFSRGAYTVRVLAGVLENYGLLKRGKPGHGGDGYPEVRRALSEAGFRRCKRSGKASVYCNRTFADARQVKQLYSMECPVHFMGIWDTVSSLGWAYDPKTFPNTAAMRHVRTIRHALALDERRAKFRSNRVEVVPGAQQDLQEVWFAGDHSDVGGGYPDEQSGLAKKCLEWMLREACQHDLRKDPGKGKRIHGSSPVTPRRDGTAARVARKVLVGNRVFAAAVSQTGKWRLEGRNDAVSRQRVADDSRRKLYSSFGSATY